MYEAITNHCILRVEDYKFSIIPRDNDYQSVILYGHFNYNLDIHQAFGIVDRTKEFNNSITFEHCTIGDVQYDKVSVDIRELPNNKRIKIVILDENNKVLYDLEDTIIKGGKYDED